MEVDSIRDTLGSNVDGLGDELVFQLLGEKRSYTAIEVISFSFFFFHLCMTML
jgi:hypothetical protein